MSLESDQQYIRSYSLLPRYFGSVIMVIAIIVLAGWQFNIQILASIVKGLGAMHPDVAICFIAIGLFFIADKMQNRPVLRQVLKLVLPFIPIAVGVITVYELVFNFSSPIESMLYPSRLLAFGYKTVPNHITGSTSLELILTGATLLLMNFKGQRIDTLINNLAGLIGLLCLLSYISCVYLIHEFHVLVFIVAMAIPTGICLLLSSLAIMYSRPDSGLMSAFTSSYPGNNRARIFLPLSVIIPVIFGLITVYVLRHNVINAEVGMTLLVTSLIFSMFILSWYLGTQINRVNIEQVAAEKLRKSEFYYRSIIEQASDAIMITNSKGEYVEANSYACTLFGYTKEEILKLSVWDLVDPEQVKTDPLQFDLIATGQTVIRERRMVRKNGSIIEVRLNVKMLPDKRALGFVYDITDKKREEKEFRNLFDQLQISETKYRSLIDEASDAIWVIDFSGSFIEVNTSLCNMLGYSKDEILPRHLSMLVDSEQLKTDPLKYDLPMDGSVVIRERRMRRKDGTIITAEWHVKRLSNNRIMTIAHDVTALRNAQKQLKASEARFRALVEDSFDAITLLDKDFKIIYRSPSAEKVTGWSFEERNRHDGLNLLHPDDAEVVTEMFKKVRENTDGLFSMTYRIRSKEGNYIWVEAAVRNMLSDPYIGAVVVIYRDITGRKKSEQELSKSEARFRALVENNFDCITLYDANINSLYRSPSSEKVTGWTNEERKSQLPYHIVHPDDRENVKKAFSDMLDHPEKAYPINYRLMHKDGHYIWIEAISHNMLNDPNVGAIVNIFRDVSERKNAEIKLLKYNRELFMLNHISDVIVRYKDENALMTQTCRLLADYGNYSLAWIGYAPDLDNPDKRVVPATKTGKAVKYLDSLKLNLENERTKRGPVSTALSTGRIKIINRFDDDPFFEPWRDAAKEHGLASLICLPFDVTEKKRGVLSIYSTQHDSFDKEEVTILQRITENLGYAIRSIRTMKERDTAIQQIIKSEEKYRMLFANNPMPMWVTGLPESNIVDVNESAINHYGYSREEFIGMDLKKMHPEEDSEQFIQSTKLDSEGVNYRGIWKHLKKNGELTKVEIFTYDIIYDDKNARLILVNDVTEKLKAEEELRQMNEQLRNFSAHLQDVREEERIHIAREIHDELGQLLTGLKIDVSWLSKRLTSQPEELSKRVDEMLLLTDRTIQSVRKIATELRPGILDDLGLEEAIIWQANEFQNKTGIASTVESCIKTKKLSSEISTAAFRILQESLTNIIRHAKAKNVKILLHEDESKLYLEIIDDGIGLNYDDYNESKSLGIMGMRERASMLGGAFNIISAPFKGTRIQVNFPFKYIV